MPAPERRTVLAYGAAFASVAQVWLWVAAAVGFAQRHLTTLPKPVAALAEVSYPMYLTHWPWLVLAGVVVLPLPLVLPVKVAAVLTVVYVGSFGTCRMLRTSRCGCLLFGMRAPERPTPHEVASSHGGVAIPPGHHPGVPTLVRESVPVTLGTGRRTSGASPADS